MQKANQLMDKIAQAIADLIGSTPVALGIVLWTVGWAVINHKQLNFLTAISILALDFVPFILRAEKIQSAQHHKDIKRDLKKSDELLEKVG